jgi:hypothetical protein
MKTIYKVTLVCAAMTLIIISVYIFMQIKFHKLEKDLTQYLISTKQYTSIDIKDIKAHFGKMPTFWVNVVFTDEPSHTYVYTDRGTGDWTQIGPTSGELDSGEKFKHYDQ